MYFSEEYEDYLSDFKDSVDVDYEKKQPCECSNCMECLGLCEGDFFY
jgi:hypothetical protein